MDVKTGLNHSSPGKDFSAQKKKALQNSMNNNTSLKNKEPSVSVDPVLLNLFKSIDQDGMSRIKQHDFFSILKKLGIDSNDPRIKPMKIEVEKVNDSNEITFDEFNTIVRHNSQLIRKVLQGDMIIPEFEKFCEEIAEIYHEVKKDMSGNVATYIPQLGRVNPDLFSVSICTNDGQRFSIGDSDERFCIQSVSKPINYCIALENHGEETVHKHVGCEPSGRGFNELTLNKDGLPHNPMINSGAIMTCSLVQPKKDIADRFDYVLNCWKRLSGGMQGVGFNNSVYLSERQTADRNFALGYFMRENRAFPEGTDLLQTLEFYFQCCSIEATTQSLAVVAGTLANAGVCPITGEKIFEPSTVQNCLSLMYSCGMYDFSGEFAFKIGFPGKSGVSGALMLVIPGIMGIAIWAPRLDELGNSAKGIEFCKQLASQYNFHNYDSLTLAASQKKDPRYKTNQVAIDHVVSTCWVASIGDLRSLQQLAARGLNLNTADYDGRTPLHLAASEGHLQCVKFLVSHGVDLAPKDRWGGTPLSDAERQDHKEVAQYLKQNTEK